MGLRASWQRWKRSGGAPEQLLRRAVRRLVAGDDAGAEADLTALARKHGDELEAFLGLAELHRRQGHVGRAIALYQNLNLRNDLDDEQRISVLAGLGHAFEAGGYGPRAVASFDQVIEREPDHEGALAGLARLLPAQGDLERALVVERRWAKLRGERDRDVEAQLLTAIAAQRLDEGRLDVARHSARRALRADRDHVEAHLLLARVEAEAHRPKRTVGHIIDALEADPERAGEFLPELERAWPDGRGRRGEWVDFLQDNARRHSESRALVDALARALVDTGAHDEAIEVVEAALVRWPHSDALRMRLGRVLLDLGRYDDALTAYEAMLDLLEKRGEAT